MGCLNQALKGLSWAASCRLARQLEAGLHLEVESEPEDIRLLSVLSPEYPSALKELSRRPAGLWVRGRVELHDRRAVAVVGTRSPSPQGLQRTFRLASLLAREQITVVSGLARGVDTAAHQACLEAGGRTLGVVGHGLRHCYPPENRNLMESIGFGGAVLSQFEPDFKPTRWSFPERNRLIAGLSRVSVAMECGPLSGTLSELQWALKLGRVVALPESLVMSQSWARSWADEGKAVVLRRETDVLSLVGEIPAVGDSG
ncbi:DNA-protecting protein DprA [bacterium]|nr:DNA-protecting protein DprA [bacterium]